MSPFIQPNARPRRLGGNEVGDERPLGPFGERVVERVDRRRARRRARLRRRTRSRRSRRRRGSRRRGGGAAGRSGPRGRRPTSRRAAFTPFENAQRTGSQPAAIPISRAFRRRNVSDEAASVKKRDEPRDAPEGGGSLVGPGAPGGCLAGARRTRFAQSSARRRRRARRPCVPSCFFLTRRRRGPARESAAGNRRQEEDGPAGEAEPPTSAPPRGAGRGRRRRCRRRGGGRRPRRAARAAPPPRSSCRAARCGSPLPIRSKKRTQDDDRPARREADERADDRREAVAEEDERLLRRRAVREPSRDDLRRSRPSSRRPPRSSRAPWPGRPGSVARKAGRSGTIISDETSVRNETHPSRTTVFGRRARGRIGRHVARLHDGLHSEARPALGEGPRRRAPHADHGVVRAAVRGARGKSKRAAALQLLTEVSVTYFRKEGADLARRRRPGAREERLRPRDERRERRCSFRTSPRAPRVFVPESEPGSDVYRLVRHVLDALEAGVDARLAARYFEAWLLRFAGLLPDDAACAACGEPLPPGDARLDAAIPGFVSSECAGRGTVAVPGPARALLAAIRRGTLGEVAAGRPPEAAVSAVDEIAREVRRRFLATSSGATASSASSAEGNLGRIPVHFDGSPERIGRRDGPADPHSEAVGVLGLEGLPPRAAVRRRGRRRDDAPGHVPARPRPRAVGAAPTCSRRAARPTGATARTRSVS